MTWKCRSQWRSKASLFMAAAANTRSIAGMLAPLARGARPIVASQSKMRACGRRRCARQGGRGGHYNQVRDVSAERKVTVVRVKREGLSFGDGEVQFSP